MEYERKRMNVLSFIALETYDFLYPQFIQSYLVNCHLFLPCHAS